MASINSPPKKHKVAIVGSGNWGSAIAKILAENTRQHEDIFEREVQMWVYEEDVTIPQTSRHYDSGSELALKPQKLTAIINRLHENIKYLPDVALPPNLIANPSIEDTVKDATVLVFNLPHQFIARICESMKSHILPYARGISCIKGIDVSSAGVSLFCESIGSRLGIYCGALSGANIANEVGKEKWCESTIAYAPPAMEQSSSSSSPKLQPLPSEYAPLTQESIKKLFHRPYFHIRLVPDVAGVSLGGALKNVVALAAGFTDGLGWGDNAKAAVMRVGILEQVKFGKLFFPTTFQPATMLEESCGVADMITSCSSGRNYRCAKMSILEKKSIEEIEEREMNGQKLQGTSTAHDVNAFLKSRGMEAEFPLLTAVYNVLEGKIKAEQIPDLIEED